MAGTPENIAWKAMKARCYYVKKKNYHKYGGRGIKVCDRWLHSFRNFFTDMGPKPTKEHTLDRIDSDGDYTPSNCRWATKAGQSQNQGVRKNNTSGAKGVRKRAKGKYVAVIGFDNKDHHIGTFDTLEEASRAYNEAAIRYHGEYAKLNEVNI